MSAVFICDGCGKQEPGEHNDINWFKPREWFERTTEDQKTIPDACSRSCVERINDDRGERKPIIPL